MSLYYDKNHLPTANFAQQQQQAQNKVKANPFGNLGLGAMEVKQDPNYGVGEQVRQPAPNKMSQPTTRPTQNTTPVRQQMPRRTSSNTRVTSEGNTLKTTPAGNHYIYNDKYDHSEDIKPKKTVAVTFRLDADVYADFKARAKRQRLSANQLLIRIMEQYRG